MIFSLDVFECHFCTESGLRPLWDPRNPSFLNDLLTSLGGALRHAGTEVDEEVERRFDGHQEMIHGDQDFEPLKVINKILSVSNTFYIKNTCYSCSFLP